MLIRIDAIPIRFGVFILHTRLLSGRGDNLVASVKTPSNAVELKICSLNLTRAVQLEIVETFDLILFSTDACEHPLPNYLVGANNTNVECRDTLDSRSACFTCNICLLAWESGTAKLSKWLDTFYPVGSFRDLQVGPRETRWNQRFLSSRLRGWRWRFR